MKLIESYARGMNRKSFWDVFNYHLKSAANLAGKHISCGLNLESLSCSKRE